MSTVNETDHTTFFINRYGNSVKKWKCKRTDESCNTFLSVYRINTAPERGREIVQVIIVYSDRLLFVRKTFFI